jgi:hypothetical protein
MDFIHRRRNGRETKCPLETKFQSIAVRNDSSGRDCSVIASLDYIPSGFDDDVVAKSVTSKHTEAAVSKPWK